MKGILPALAISLPMIAISMADMLTANASDNAKRSAAASHPVARAETERERLMEHRKALSEWGIPEDYQRVFAEVSSGRSLSDEEVVNRAFVRLQREGFDYDELSHSKLIVEGEEENELSEEEEIERWWSERTEALQFSQSEDASNEARAIVQHAERFRQMRVRQLDSLDDFDDRESNATLVVKILKTGKVQTNTNHDKK